jgi:hypothetical protein
MTSLPRGATAAAFAALLAGCGARASLIDGTRADGSTGGAFGSTTSAGGAGGACATLVWAGDAVEIPLGGLARRPRLVHTDVAEDTVLVEVVTDAPELSALRLSAWWTAWPPPMGAPVVVPGSQVDVGKGGDAVAAGPQGSFAFVSTYAGMLELDEVTAGGAFVTGLGWSGTGITGPALALGHDNQGDYLVLHGSVQAPAMDLLRAPFSSATPLLLGPAGCASAPVAVSAVGNGGGDGSFLVAVNGAGPHGTCIDPSPLGPPNVVQILHVDSLGVVFAGDALSTGPVEDLQVVGRIGGGWLGYHVPSDGVFHMQQVDSQGHLGDSFALPLASPLETSTVVAYGQGFARASAQRGDPEAPAFVRLALLDGAVSAQIEATLPLGTTLEEAPALAASDDGRQILVAYVARSSHGIPELWLRRADCAGGF